MDLRPGMKFSDFDLWCAFFNDIQDKTNQLFVMRRNDLLQEIHRKANVNPKLKYWRVTYPCC